MDFPKAPTQQHMVSFVAARMPAWRSPMHDLI